MTLFDKLSLLRPEKCGMDPQSRIWAQLTYAANVSQQRGREFDALINGEADVALHLLQTQGALTLSDAQAMELRLSPLSGAAKSYTAHCVGHAHIDMNWMWGYNETAAVTVETFRTVLDLMREYPLFTFGQSQASTYRIIEENAPEMLTEIRQRVHEGRWEVTASTWVENDKNMAGGEALCRHILYTKQYLSRLLDIDPKSLDLDFQPDTFGHSINVPEACFAGGIKYYYHCRGREDYRPAYVWRSRAGHELLVYQEPHWYNTDIEPGLFTDYPLLCREMASQDFLVVYGVGDHGGGPTRRDLDRLIEIASWPIMPTILFSTYSRFFAELEKSRDSLPVYTGENNFTFTGCYTSQSRIKMANHVGEDRLYESEMLCAASRFLAGDVNRQARLDESWRDVLFNQFHDILPGSGTIETREYAMGRFQSAMAGAQTSASCAMHALADAIDTSALAAEAEPDSNSEGAGVGRGVGQNFHFAQPSTGRSAGKKRIFHLFNSTSSTFNGVCSVTVWDWAHDPALALFRNEEGDEIPCQFVEEGKRYWGHNYKTFLIRAWVPAFGYTTCTLENGSIEKAKVGVFTDRIDHHGDAPIVLENELIRAEFNADTMLLTSLIDKKSNTVLTEPGSAGFALIQENAQHGMTAWRVGERAEVRCINRESRVLVGEAERGRLRSSVSYKCDFGQRSKLEVTVSLASGSRVLEFAVRTDFQESGTRVFTPQLSFEAIPAYFFQKYRCDVPLGLLDRDEMAQDAPALSFVSPLLEPEEKPVLALLADSKYGFRAYDGVVSVTLIRGSSDPDPYPEYGWHDTRLGLCVLPEAEPDALMNASQRFLHPISVCSARAHKGTLPLSESLLTADGARVIAVKQASDGKGLILRLCEYAGEDGAFSVRFPFPIEAARICDVNEAPLKMLKWDEDCVTGSISAHALLTLYVEPGVLDKAAAPIEVTLPEAQKLGR